MRRGVLLTAAAVLLVGPTVLAFHSGGYFDGPRFVGTITAWGLVLVAAIAFRRPLPRTTPGRVAVAGLALLTAWTALSLTWAPLSESATDSLVRLLLYAGALIAAAALLREPLARRWAEPVLALGVLVVIGYGLSGRLLPGIIHLHQSATALGRLEQPITYWNAEGALAAIGFVLSARIAGSPARPAVLRIAAAAACAPLGMGVYLSYSRGALAAAVAGLVVLVAAAPTRAQLRAAAAALAAAVLAAVAAQVFGGVSSLAGTLADRERDGAIVLVLLALIAVAAAAAQARACRVERADPAAAGRLSYASRLPAVAAVLAAVALAGLVVAGFTGSANRSRAEKRTGIARLGSADSRRYDYWKVALNTFADHPLRGVGAGGFRVEWNRERPVRESALEAHSLPLEMLSELGIPGFLFFGMLVGGTALAGRRALRLHPELAPGACAGAAVFALHSAIDWDWQLPAVALPALILAGALVAMSDDGVVTAPAATATRARRAGSVA
jgi:hypothetical protein